jgi:hypothetical protein
LENIGFTKVQSYINPEMFYTEEENAAKVGFISTGNFKVFGGDIAGDYSQCSRPGSLFTNNPFLKKRSQTRRNYMLLLFSNKRASGLKMI